MDEPPHRVTCNGRKGGFALLEMTIVIALVTFFAGVLLTELLYYQELAEKTAVELTLINMRSGVRFQIADKMIHGREAELKQLVASNPVDWLHRPPPGYVGEIRNPAHASLRPGEWFFDTRHRELGYVPRLHFHLSFASPSRRALRWRIRGSRSRKGDIQDLSLVSVTPYRWF